MTDAEAAVALFAADPAGTGVRLCLPPGPARDAWLDALRAALPPGAPVRRVPLHVSEDRLFGGTDLAATLAAGRTVRASGLAEGGGVLILAMAERVAPSVAARLAAAMDGGAGFGLIALDDGQDGEAPPECLLQRLAFTVGDTSLAESAPAGAPDASDAEPAALFCGLAHRLGIASLRAPIQALHAARLAARRAGRPEPGEADLALAARLVLAPRATRLPEMGEEEEQPEPPQPEDDRPSDTAPIEDRLVEAALAAIPPGLLTALAAGAIRSRSLGKAGARTRNGLRGRPAGSQSGDPRRGERLDVVATLRQAAPWQALRDHAPGRIAVRPADLRVVRRKPRSETTTVFVVDASGSAALHRLGEAKGAVELLLAECYVRRDRVAVIGFRGAGAELLLAPTRSLPRAKRALAGLPGGGGTPLAAGIEAGAALADAVRRRGGTPTLVLLTDGRANIARDGTSGRAGAEADALAAARTLLAAGHRAMLIDTSPRPYAPAAQLAAKMGARYVPLPHADAAALARTVRMAAA